MFVTRPSEENRYHTAACTAEQRTIAFTRPFAISHRFSLNLFLNKSPFGARIWLRFVPTRRPQNYDSGVALRNLGSSIFTEDVTFSGCCLDVSPAWKQVSEGALGSPEANFARFRRVPCFRNSVPLRVFVGHQGTCQACQFSVLSTAGS